MVGILQFISCYNMAKGLLFLMFAVLLEDPAVATVIESCSNPLVNKDQPQMLSSSSFHSSAYSPAHALINSTGAWIPQSWNSSISEYLQIDLGTTKFVTSIATRGASGISGYFVKKYILKLSLDGMNYEDYKEDGDDRVFDGNTDNDGMKINTLNCPHVTRFLRIYPFEIQKRVALRVEVYGCNTSVAETLQQGLWLLNVSNIQVNSVTHSRAQISWSAFPFRLAREFQLTYGTERNISEMKLIPATESTDYAYNMTDLLPCTKYVITLYAHGRCSMWIKEAHLQTTASRPAAPVILNGTSPASNTIQIKWQDPGTIVPRCPIEITGYRIVFRKTHDSSWSQEREVDSSRFMIYVSGLENWTEYTVDVYARSAFGLSRPGSAQVDVDGKAPESPPILTEVNSTSPGTILVKWKPPPPNTINGELKKFALFYKEKESEGWTSVTYPPQRTEALITHLTEESFYEVYLMMFNNKYNVSTNTTEVYVRGQGPTHTLDFNITSEKPGELYIIWKVHITKGKIISSCCTQLRWKETSSVDWYEVALNNERTTNYTVKGLMPWTKYEVQVLRQVNAVVVSATPKSILILGRTPGKPPKSIKAVALSPSTVKVIWKSIPRNFVYEPVEGYVVYYTEVESPLAIRSNETVRRTWTIKGLKAATEYAVQVAGYSKGGAGVKSAQLVVKTKNAVLPPSAPRITLLKALSASEIEVFWRTDEWDLLDFQLRITGPDGQTWSKTVTAEANTAAYSDVIHGLQPYQAYKVTLRSRKRKYEEIFVGDYAQEGVTRTKEAAPDKPLELKAIVEDDRVLLQWKPPLITNGVVRRYIVTIRSELNLKSPVVYSDTVANSTFEYRPKNLIPHCNYSVEVRAVTVQAGPEAVVHFTSPEGLPSEPYNVSAEVNGSKVRISWHQPKAPHGIVEGYKVEYSGHKQYMKSFQDIQTFVPEGTHTTAVVDVYPGTNYTISVTAKTGRGFGKESVPLMIMIPPQPLEPPPTPIILDNSVTPHSVTLELQNYVVKNGQMSAVEVIVERKYRRRRSASLTESALPSIIGDFDYAKKRGYSFYVAARIYPDQLPMKFVVGDGKKYNGFYNAPLDPQTHYVVHTRGLSVNQRGDILYGERSFVALPVTDAKKVSASGGKSGWNVPLPIIIGVAGALLFLIILVVIIILYLRTGTAQRNRAKHHYSANDSELAKLRAPSEADHNRATSLTGDVPVHPEHPPLPATNFSKHVTKLHRNESEGFSSEYNQLEMGKEFSWDTAHLTENRPKNRYANIVAYDHSRVVLSTIDGDPCSDYINASYIDGYMRPNAYIATQGPLPNTFNDFWRMVWEVRAHVVIMLTNLEEKNKLKCHKYWPDETTEYDDIKVTLNKREVYADYTIRTFRLQRSTCGVQESRQVKQFHFTVWPDHGVPDYATAILAFRRRVRAYNPPDCGPHVVHCSAGVGRTGTYITIDSMLERLDKQGDVDVFNFIAAMRTRRIAMVQTEEQYVFVHDAVMEYVTCGNTQITAQDLRIAIKKREQMNSDTRMTGFEKEWKILNHASPVLPKTEFQVALLAENVIKNRYSCVVPSDYGRVRLLPLDEDESTTYINAVYVDGYKQRNSFILTQCPLPNTGGDFWRMLCEHRSASVVMLCSLEEGDDYFKFWPDTGSLDFELISVECLAPRKGESSSSDNLKSDFRRAENEVIMRKFKVTDARDADSQLVVKLFQFVGWTETRAPGSCKGIISLVSLVEKWQQHSGNGPITILCSDGLGRSGTFAALVAVLERVKVEQVVDVFQAIKAMRIQRPHLVKYMLFEGMVNVSVDIHSPNSKDQYKFIHYAVQEYLTAFDDYANFK